MTAMTMIREADPLERLMRRADVEALKAFSAGKGDAPTIYKAVGRLKAANTTGPLEFIASDSSEDRMGDIIEANGWDLDGFQENPVVQLGHDSRIPPIGRAPLVHVRGKQLLTGPVSFDPDDPLATLVESKLRGGFMAAVSVGFRPLRFSKLGDNTFRFIEQELLEISVVNIPANPRGLSKIIAGRQGFAPMPTKATAAPSERPLTAAERRLLRL